MHKFVLRTAGYLRSFPFLLMPSQISAAISQQKKALHTVWGQGYAVAQVVELLLYKPEGRELISVWGHRLNPSGCTTAVGST